MPDDFLLVNTKDGLKRALYVLQQQDALAIDVEFDNKYSYDLVICLIQVSTGDEIFLFDPLSIELNPLGQVFTNPDIIKIFFDGLQDIQLLQTHYHWQIRSIVDVSTVYRISNNEKNQTSLVDVIFDTLDIEIDKNKQIQSREDWKQRPLPQDMLRYAAQDVEYLHDVLLYLQQDLNKETLSLLEVYFLQIPLVENQVENTLMYAFYLCQSYRVHEPVSRHLMFKLIKFREKTAEFTNQSSGYILSRANLGKLVRKQPTTVQELKQENLYYRNLKKYAHEILGIIQNNTGDNVSFDPYFEVLERRYKKYFPYHKYLNHQNKWPFSIDISTYKHRRNILRVSKEMLIDRVGEDATSFIFTKYLRHQIALHENVNLYDFRISIENSDDRSEMISTIYRWAELIYDKIIGPTD